MTIPQIISVVGAVVVAGMYLVPLIPALKPAGDTLTHLKHIIAVRDAYPSQAVKDKANALMEAILEIK